MVFDLEKPTSDEFDANQNLWTQCVERIFWERLGIPSKYLDLYFSNKVRRKLVSRFFKAIVKYAKTSGEPLTLAGNTSLAAVMSDYAFDYAVAALVIKRRRCLRTPTQRAQSLCEVGGHDVPLLHLPSTELGARQLLRCLRQRWSFRA